MKGWRQETGSTSTRFGLVLEAAWVLVWGLPAIMLAAALTSTFVALMFVPPVVLLVPWAVEALRSVWHAVISDLDHVNGAWHHAVVVHHPTVPPRSL